MCKLVPGNMAGDTDIYSLPLTLLPYRTRKQLSYLLNSTKILPCDGPDRLPRDWRGLASLVNISSEVAASFHQYSDKTAKVLDIWLQDPTVTVGTLLQYMQRLDRYDVHDDILNDLRGYVARGELVVNQPYNQVAVNNNHLAPLDEDYSIITVDDRPGYEQHYHAFILYADADRDFVDELNANLGGAFQICTKEKLLPGHATEYAPVAQLISQRCQYIILVYSPDFLSSPADTFYRDYAQAVSIESRRHNFQRKIIPIMYRQCKLPVHLMYYHKLYYKNEGRAMYDFWEKLRQSIGQSAPPRLYQLPVHLKYYYKIYYKDEGFWEMLRHNIAQKIPPRINGTVTPHSAVKIVEMPNSNGVTNGTDHDARFFLPPPEKSRSYTNGVEAIPSTSKIQDGQSISSLNISDNTVKKKKRSPFKWMFSRDKKRKAKKESQMELN